jgi:enoyl-CoA hydratase/carnithine racemase
LRNWDKAGWNRFSIVWVGRSQDRVQSPAKAECSYVGMYTQFAELLNTAQANSEIRVVLVSAAGDNYSAGNDLQDFLDHPPGDGDSPQKQMIDALRVLDKPLVGAVRGAAVGSNTMLTYFDFVYASQVPVSVH